MHFMPDRTERLLDYELLTDQCRSMLGCLKDIVRE